MAKAATYEDVIYAIAKNYNEIESSIVNQLLLNVPNHYSTEGSYRENVWKQLFEMVIPRKYCIEQGVFIIDSYGHKSKEIDLVIFDELYTPYIFNYGKIKFIPIEAVSAVVQCKSVNLNNNEILEWVESVDKLITSMDSVARLANMVADNNIKETQVTQTATRPIKVLCTLANKEKLVDYEGSFDILLSADEQKKKLIKVIKNESMSFDRWNESLNHNIDKIENLNQYEFRKAKKKYCKSERDSLLQDLKVNQEKEENEIEENVIFTLIFQFNQLLMVLNNPMLFPHRAYAQYFTGILGGNNQDKGVNENGRIV